MNLLNPEFSQSSISTLTNFVWNSSLPKQKSMRLRLMVREEASKWGYQVWCQVMEMDDFASYQKADMGLDRCSRVHQLAGPSQAWPVPPFFATFYHWDNVLLYTMYSHEIGWMFMIMMIMIICNAWCCWWIQMMMRMKKKHAYVFDHYFESFCWCGCLEKLILDVFGMYGNKTKFI